MRYYYMCVPVAGYKYPHRIVVIGNCCFATFPRGMSVGGRVVPTHNTNPSFTCSLSTISNSTTTITTTTTTVYNNNNNSNASQFINNLVVLN